jgi:hypothetical protein
MFRLEMAVYAAQPDLGRHILQTPETFTQAFVKQQMTMLDMQDFVLRHTLGEFLLQLSSLQVDSLLRDCYNLLGNNRESDTMITLEDDIDEEMRERV